MAARLERFQKRADVLRGAGGIESHQAHRRAPSENRDHDCIVIDRVHEHVIAVSLVIERIELDLADASRQFLRRRERTGG